MKKHKDIEVEEESVLLKTIKLTKNINYLTEKLPKPNYSPLRYKSMLNNRSAYEVKKNKLKINMKFSLPPIKQGQIRSERSINKKKVHSKEKLKNEASLPRLAVKDRKSKPYLY